MRYRDCGACKVLIDGVATNSCTVLARNAENHEILTIEGLGNGETLHPVQQAFIESGAIQCGFCTPGMVMTSVDLLSRNINPTDQEIFDAFDNNICRCTSYVKIVEAVKLASLKMRGE